MHANVKKGVEEYWKQDNDHRGEVACVDLISHF